MSSSKNSKKGHRLRLQFVYPPNQDMVIIHTNILLSKGFVGTGSLGGFNQDAGKDVPVIGNLMCIDGCQEVYTKDYEITFTKARVFKWDELIEAIQAAIELELHDSEEEVEILDSVHHAPNLDPYGTSRRRPFGFMGDDLDW